MRPRHSSPSSWGPSARIPAAAAAACSASCDSRPSSRPPTAPKMSSSMTVGKLCVEPLRPANARTSSHSAACVLKGAAGALVDRPSSHEQGHLHTSCIQRNGIETQLCIARSNSPSIIWQMFLTAVARELHTEVCSGAYGSMKAGETGMGQAMDPCERQEREDFSQRCPSISP